MIMRLLEDLRFVVGLLFGIISVILLGVALLGQPQVNDEMQLNLVTGAAMVVFSAIMLGMALAADRADGAVNVQ
jgi:uncharacterized membrane protein HdeD (DUF308 family)